MLTPEERKRAAAFRRTYGSQERCPSGQVRKGTPMARPAKEEEQPKHDDKS
jgi:hypothetical protein